MLRIFAAHIYRSAGFLKEFSPAPLPPDVLEKISRYHFEEDRLRAQTSQLLLRYVLRHEYAVPDKEPEFGRNTWGKPFLRDYPGLHFNISHSGEWVVCAVADRPVGIDIEKIRTIDVDELKGFLSPAEREALEHIPTENREAYFYSLWTLKESYIKAVGSGLQIALDSFSIHFKGDEITLSAPGTEHFAFRQLAIEEGYKLAVCSEEDMFAADPVICFVGLSGKR